MKVQCFPDTGTLCIEFRDSNGKVCAIAFEHASERTGEQGLTVEGIAAK